MIYNFFLCFFDSTRKCKKKESVKKGGDKAFFIECAAMALSCRSIRLSAGALVILEARAVQL